MERQGKFQRLANHREIEASCVGSIRDGKFSVEATRGLEEWAKIFPHIMTLLHESGEKDLRLFLGGHTYVVERYDDKIIAAVFKTGNPVAKSIRRMMRSPRPT